MAKVMPGRFTADIDGPFVVFIIGMRINRIFSFRKWLPVFLAMRPMLQALEKYPEKGFLGAQSMIYWRGPALVQYWRSFEDLERFSRNPSDPHLKPWQRFNKAIGGDGSVGIWHETYKVEAGAYECIYGNMPVFGLAKATRHVSVSGSSDTAKRRMGGAAEREPATPGVGD